MRWFSRPPDIVIGEPENPYMLRWYLIPRNRWCNVYLHKICRDDDDRALHDHPAVSVSLLLSGGYYDLSPGPDGTIQRVWKRAGSIVFRSASGPHRIECGRDAMKKPVPVWTLFWFGPKFREWMFHCPGGPVHWRDYTSGKHGETIGKGCDQ